MMTYDELYPLDSEGSSFCCRKKIWGFRHCSGIDMLSALDFNGVSASGGSASNSGSHGNSHVLEAMYADATRQSIRFSFSKYNTVEEVEFLAEKLLLLAKERAVA